MSISPCLSLSLCLSSLTIYLHLSLFLSLSLYSLTIYLHLSLSLCLSLFSLTPSKLWFKPVPLSFRLRVRGPKDVCVLCVWRCEGGGGGMLGGGGVHGGMPCHGSHPLHCSLNIWPWGSSQCQPLTHALSHAIKSVSSSQGCQ